MRNIGTPGNNGNTHTAGAVTDGLPPNRLPSTAAMTGQAVAGIALTIIKLQGARFIRHSAVPPMKPSSA